MAYLRRATLVLRPPGRYKPGLKVAGPKGHAYPPKSFSAI
jgi:hypothetical protein